MNNFLFTHFSLSFSNSFLRALSVSFFLERIKYTPIKDISKDISKKIIPLTTLYSFCFKKFYFRIQ